jgi:predicted RNase H-like nuclease (RuvC/YqgF family)
MDRDPTQLQSEINQLIKKQLDTLGREIFGGVTDAEHREYEQRQRRIDELYGELQRLKSAA